MQSLTVCEAQQTQLLQHEVTHLQTSFRQKLADLEADFIARAEALSDELCASVAERKGRCEANVAQHAAALTQSIRTLHHPDKEQAWWSAPSPSYASHSSVLRSTRRSPHTQLSSRN